MLKRPYLIVEWNDTETEAKGWLCVYNFVKNYTGGGTRMHPTVTKEEVIRLATVMAYKNNAAEMFTTGGAKGGIAYDYKAPDANDVLRRYMIAMTPYLKAGVSLGSDLGTDYNYILGIFNEMGIGIPQTKAMRADVKIKQGIKDFDAVMAMTYDGFLVNDMVTGYGVAWSADEAWKISGKGAGAKVVIQGFGCVGASCARALDKLGYKIVGIADANCLLECQSGLDVNSLVDSRLPKGEMDKDKFRPEYKVRPNTEWLDVDCDILIPAALEDVIHKDNAYKVRASLIVEGANIPITAEADEILKNMGVEIVTDFIANLGAGRFYDSIIFGYVEPTATAVATDVEQLCRRNTRKIYAEAQNSGKTLREVSYDIFTPTVFDTPDN